MKSQEHKNLYFLREHGRRENLCFFFKREAFFPSFKKTSFLVFLLRKAFLVLFSKHKLPFLSRKTSFLCRLETKLSFVFCERFLSFFTRKACSFSSTRNFHVLSSQISFHCISKVMLSFFFSQRIAFLF